MNVQYCSDLHLEFYDNKNYLEQHPLYPEGDILLLAGDIVTLDRIGLANDFFSYVGDNFEAVYWVPGNHEYYHGDISERTGSFQEKVRSNITLVNNSAITYKGIEFIFSTLWSAISLQNAWRVERGLNDFYQVLDKGQRFTTMRYHELHREAVAFLTDSFNEPAKGARVVVTHHLPTFKHYPPEYAGDVLNEAFASHLDSLVETSGADYWLYGHHHRNINNFRIGNTQLVTNQLGYVHNNEHFNFRRDAVLEV